MGTDLFATSPGFEINDAGFGSDSDDIFHGVWLSRRWLDPGKVFRRFNLNATWAQSWNFGGTNVGRSAYFGLGGQLLNYWSFNVGSNLNLRTLTDYATRGGPLMTRPRQLSVNWNVELGRTQEGRAAAPTVPGAATRRAAGACMPGRR